MQTAISIGLALGPVIGGALFTAGGFGLPFWVLGGVYVVLDILMCATLPDLDQKSDELEQTNTNRDKKANMFVLLWDKSMILDVLAQGAVAFAITYYDAVISIHLKPIVNNEFEIALVIMTAAVAEIFVAPITGYFLDHGLGARLCMVVSMFMSICGLLLMGPSPVLPFLNK